MSSFFIKYYDSMHQVSLMQDFMYGEYGGVINVGDFKTHGGIGLEAFEGVNGEMIVFGRCCLSGGN